MADLTTATFSLQEILNRIEANRGQAMQHRSNANLANAGSVLAYLLTSGSKNRTVRTVGGVAALGGVLYGSSQRNQAANFDAQNSLLFDSGLSRIELDGLLRLRTETNPDVKRKFLELVLRISSLVNEELKRNGSKIKNKSLLWRKNQDLLMLAGSIDIIRNKLRLNRVFSQIDRTKVFPDYNGVFNRQVSAIDVKTLRKEGLYSKIFIGSCIVLGLILANKNSSAVILLLLGIGFWAVNHFFPLFPETRKLKNALKNLVNGLQNQPPIQNLQIP